MNTIIPQNHILAPRAYVPLEEGPRPTLTQALLKDVQTAALYTIGILGAVYLLNLSSPFLFAHLEVFKNPDVVLLCQKVTALATVIIISTIWLALLGMYTLQAPILKPSEIV